jgi:hypothetical protein
MAVLLTEDEQFETWLSGIPKEVFGLVSYDPEKKQIVEEGSDKGVLLAA